MTSQDLDRAFRGTAYEVGSRFTLPRPGTFLESFLEAALTQALAERLPGASVGHKKLDIPDWNPQPGNVDIAVQEGDVHVAFAEVKIEKVEECLWDAYKLAAACTRDGALGGYLTVAALAKTWDSDRDCVELFPEEDETVVFESEALFRENRKAWKYLLGGGRGRPTRVPRKIEVSGIGCVTLANVPPYEYELRVARVRRVGVEWLEFLGDWPLGVEPNPVMSVLPKSPHPDLFWLPSRISSNRATSEALFALNVPGLTEDRYAALLRELRRRGWNDKELSERVAVHRYEHDVE